MTLSDPTQNEHKILDPTHPDQLLCDLPSIEYQKYGNIRLHTNYKLTENTSFQSPLKIQNPSLCTHFSADSEYQHDINRISDQIIQNNYVHLIQVLIRHF